MANNKQQTTGGRGYWNVNETGLLALGNTSEETVGSMLVQIVGTGLTGSFTVKGRLTGAHTGTNGYVPIPYRRRSLGGVASDDTTVSAAITGDALIVIEADGLDIAIEVTALSAGSAKVYVLPLRG